MVRSDDRRAPGAPHHPQCRRRHEDVADPGPGDHVERQLGVEPTRPVGDDGHAVGERRHDDVVEAADPRPVGGCPDAVARLREEVVRELETRQVAGEDAVAVEGTLRQACRPRRVDEQRGRVRGRRRGGELGRCRREQPVELAVDVDRDPVEAELGHPLERLPLAEHGAHVGAAQPQLERVEAEHLAQRHDDRPELVDRDVRDRGLGPLGEDQGDPVARPDAEARRGRWRAGSRPR